MGNSNRKVSGEEFYSIIWKDLKAAHINTRDIDEIRLSISGPVPLTEKLAHEVSAYIIKKATGGNECSAQEEYQPKRLQVEPAEEEDEEPCDQHSICPNCPSCEGCCGHFADEVEEDEEDDDGYEIPSAKMLMAEIREALEAICSIVQETNKNNLSAEVLFIMADLNGIAKRGLQMLSVMRKLCMDPDMDPKAVSAFINRHNETAARVDEIIAAGQVIVLKKRCQHN